jgi:hypothetical protein
VLRPSTDGAVAAEGSDDGVVWMATVGRHWNIERDDPR